MDQDPGEHQGPTRDDSLLGHQGIFVLESCIGDGLLSEESGSIIVRSPIKFIFSTSLARPTECSVASILCNMH